MQPGTVIAGRYRVEQLAHQGGMGAVYIGRDLEHDQVVGIKLLLDPSSESAVTRFVTESKALAALDHPGIVRYLTHGTTDTGEPYLVMEWLEGEDLAKRLRYGPLDVANTLQLGIRVCDALEAAHQNNILHRDIKPENLFLTDKQLDQVTVVDFGLARLGGAHNEHIPVGKFIGTPAYMSPEQARGDRALDHRADLYSLGAALFTCLTQRPPFVGEHMTAVLAKVLFEQAPCLREMRVGIPPELDALMQRLLAKDPNVRPEYANEIAASLADIHARLGRDKHSPRPRPATPTTTSRHFATVLIIKSARELRQAHRTGPVARAAANFGTRLEVMADSTIVGVFCEPGEPVAGAINAARCALALRMEVGIGATVLATGRALVSDRLAVGAVIDRAVATLQQHLDERAAAAAGDGEAAHSDEIVIDDATVGLLGDHFVIASRGPRRYRLLGQASRQISGPRLLGALMPCVGRQRELGVLSGILSTCAAQNSARLVLVTGAAGMGKSRLASEFAREVAQRPRGQAPQGQAPRDVEIWPCCGDDTRKSAAGGLLCDLVRRAIGLTQGQPVATQHERLRARVAAALPAREVDQVTRVTVFLAELVRIPFDAAHHPMLATARRESQLMHDQTQRSFIDWLAGELAAHPIAIVIDDAHHSDTASLRFLDAALRALREQPLMVLALAQPESRRAVLDEFEAHRVEHINLGALSTSASRSLVEHTLAHLQPVLSPAEQEAFSAVATAVIDRSAGNALFLEELIRVMARGDQIELPATIRATTEIRLAQLPSVAVRVLAAASIFGQRFWHGGVAALMGDSISPNTLDELLSQLLDRELIVEQAASRFADEREYRFLSPSVRDVAYGRLTGEEQMYGHACAGRWLEAKGEPEAALLAEHFRRGYALGEAIDCCRRAAEQALVAADTDAVLSRVTEAAGCGADGEQLGELRLLEATAHNWRDEPNAARRSSFEAMRLSPRRTLAWADATHQAALAHRALGLFDDVSSLLDLLLHYRQDDSPQGMHLIAVANTATELIAGGYLQKARNVEQIVTSAITDDTDTRITAAVTHMSSELATQSGELDRAYELKLAAADHWRALGDERRALTAAGDAGYLQYQLGSYHSAAKTLRKLIKDAPRVGLDHLVGINQANLALALARLGKTREAERLCHNTLDHYSTPRQDALAYTYLAHIMLLDAQLDNALTYVRRALVASEQFLPIRCYALSLQARLLLLVQRTSEALEAVHASMSLLDSAGIITAGEAGLRLTFVEALSSAGHTDDARDALRAAVERLKERAEHISDPAHRQRFLTRISEHTRTIALGRRIGIELTTAAEAPPTPTP